MLSEQPIKTKHKVGGNYAHYTLGVLWIVYMFEVMDKSLISILAEDIKADLGTTDAQMGFLVGTAFGLCYALFGIPFARLADVWTRRNVLAIGLSFWSLVTVLTGLARSFSVLTAFRFAMGIGTSANTPTSISMISDRYPSHRRQTVMAILHGGLFAGMGLGVFVGGFILDWWATAYPTDPPFGLKGWQVAFIAVGTPGLLVAAWVRTLREPRRGMSEGLIEEKHPAPFRLLGAELMAVIPPLNLFGLLQHRKALLNSLTVALGIALVAWGLILLTGSVAQWIALGIGAYATFSWAQSLKIRDPVTFGMMFGSKAYTYTVIALSVVVIVPNTLMFWFIPFFLRTHDASTTEIGISIGILTALGGLLGTLSGGILGDYLRRRFPNGRLFIAYLHMFGTTPMVLLLVFYSESLQSAYWFFFLSWLFMNTTGMTAPAIASLLVMPRMRAAAVAFFYLVSTLIGMGVGPYVVGKISDMFQAGGMNEAESLRIGIAMILLVYIPGIMLLIMAQRHLPREEANRLERARALGEPVDERPG